MNKWIAEFDLEDGDTMPEHMDLEYKGAKLDFHCRPLEQEPFINKPCLSSEVCEYDKNKVLDKIREEIKVMTSNRGFLSCSVGYIHEEIDNVFDKYKAESEDKEWVMKIGL